MITNVENFKPKLRAGRVIPQGSRIIFETTDPYNQIVLPMVLADMILLCSGQFSVREIVEKIYGRHGSVPFRPMLTALHMLHQGGFFENGGDLHLSPELRSWMNLRPRRWTRSRRIKARATIAARRPNLFYAVTLSAIILSIFGVARAPAFFIESARAWLNGQSFATSLLQVLVISMAVQSLRYALRTVQLLTLTGKAFNLAIRFDLWGVHYAVGDEANELINNRLFAAMFYVSQIMMGWFCVFLGDALGPEASQFALILVASAITLVELNPFENGDGRKLLRALVLPNDRDLTSAHFGAESLSIATDPRTRRLERDFARICAGVGVGWLAAAMLILYAVAIQFGPALLTHLTGTPAEWLAPAANLLAWLAAVYYVAQTFVDSILLHVMRPLWRAAFARASALLTRPNRDWASVDVVHLIEELPLFSHFPEAMLESIALHSQVFEYPAGAAILTEGAPATEIFVLFEGSVEIVRTAGAITQHLGELEPISVFGEAALVDNAPRAANVVAKTKVTALRVPIAVLRKGATGAKSVRKLEVFRNAILVNQFFASSPVFRSLTTASIDFLSSRGALEYFDQGQVVFHQGDRGDHLYLVLRGAVGVELHGSEIRRLDQGNFFGEIAMIANLPRTATIRTAAPCVLFKIGADAFWEILVQHMDLGVFIESVSETRLKEDLAVTAAKASGESN